MAKRILMCLALTSAVLAQPSAARRATNIEALLAYPDFFNGRAVILNGNVATADNGELRVSDGNASVRLVYKDHISDGLSEVRGFYWDVGRFKPDDPRVATLDLMNTFHLSAEGPWPRPGELTAVFASSIAPASAPSAPTIRSIVLFPTRYTDQRVAVTGQFAGRNLFGDLPDAPGKSQYDFVLRTTDAAIWVTGMKPKGKDFDLALDRRLDAGRWLEVAGVVRQGRGLQWIQGEAGTLKLGRPPTEPTETASEPVARVPAAPPPEVIFSAPTDGETDVPIGTDVRIQLSRDIDPKTLKGNIHVSYAAQEAVERGEPTSPATSFTPTWGQANRMLELKFDKPFDRFRTVKIELTGDILGTDGQHLKPWTLTFGTGG